MKYQEVYRMVKEASMKKEAGAIDALAKLLFRSGSKGFKRLGAGLAGKTPQLGKGTNILELINKHKNLGTFEKMKETWKTRPELGSWLRKAKEGLNPIARDYYPLDGIAGKSINEGTKLPVREYNQVTGKLGDIAKYFGISTARPDTSLGKSLIQDLKKQLAPAEILRKYKTAFNASKATPDILKGWLNPNRNWITWDNQDYLKAVAQYLRKFL